MNKVLIPATILIYFSCNDDSPSVNQAPTISPVPDKVTVMNKQVPPFEITVSDPDTEISQVSLSAVSDDQILLPDSNIEIDGTGNNRLTIILPARDEIGSTIIEVKADDGQATSMQSFSLTVDRAPSTWQQKTSGTPNDLNSVYFLGDSLGWIVGAQETILKTVDSGDNWSEIPSGNLMEDLKDIAFGGTCCGWIVGHHNDGVTTSGKVLYSLDLGETWEEQVSFSNGLNTIFVSESSLTWVAGENGFIAFTSNSGQSWFGTNTSGNENINSIFFIDDNVGWVVGDEASIYITVDSGENWSKLNISGGFDLNAIFFIDEFTGWACGSANTVIKTSNGGLSWFDFKPSVGFPEDNWQGISFIDENTGWLIGESGRIFITRDGGASWNYDGISEIVSNLRSITMIDEYTGYIVGEEGTLLEYKP
jgi:photosystem II stability/assembly factor-like uncharacterized protein